MSEEPENKKPRKKKKSDDFSLDFNINGEPAPPVNNPTPPSRSIEDLLKMENVGSSTTGGVNDLQLEEEKKKLEERRTKLAEYKKELTDLRAKGIDDYMDVISKQLIEKGMVMLDAMQKEIEENPKGRDIETVAAMMSSINSIVDNLNKQKIYRQKMSLEERKLLLKEQSASSGNINATQNNTFLIAGSHTELLDMIRGDKPFPNEQLKDAEIIKEPLKDDDKNEI